MRAISKRIAMAMAVIAGMTMSVPSLITEAATDIELSAGIGTILDVADETPEDDEAAFHKEIKKILGVVENNLPGYDFNELAIAITDDSVNMRQEPNTDCEIVGKIGDGAVGTIIDGTDGWTKIKSGSVEGWVSDEFLLFGNEAEEKATTVGSYKATVNGDGLRIRKEASAEAGVYELAENGATYVVAEQTDEWIGITLGDKTGYLKAEYVSVEYTLPVAKSMEQIKAEEAAKKAAEEKAKKEAEAKKRAEAEKKAAASGDVNLLAAIVQVEAGNEPFEGKLAVASVVMNRVKSPGYPNSVSGVIYAPGQFPPAHGARMASLVAGGASADCVKAAKQAIGGVSNVGGLTHFHAAHLGGSIVIGNHAFY